MNRNLTEEVLQLETAVFTGTGGVSAGSRGGGFRPAFQDTHTRAVYLSRSSGRVEAVRPGVVSGFVRDGEFYTREEAARRVAELH